MKRNTNAVFKAFNDTIVSELAAAGVTPARPLPWHEATPEFEIETRAGKYSFHHGLNIDPDEQGEARRNTLALHAVDGAPNQQRGLYRKVSVGRIGSDAEIVWEYKTPDGWLEASSEEEAKVLCSPNRPTSSTPAGLQPAQR